jgi:hypothetical protein
MEYNGTLLKQYKLELTTQTLQPVLQRTVLFARKGKNLSSVKHEKGRKKAEHRNEHDCAQEPLYRGSKFFD